MNNVASIEQARMRREDPQDESISSGYIKLYRSLQGVSFKRNPERMALWIHMLLEASRKPYKPYATLLGGKSITLKTGQFISGLRDLEKETGVSMQKIRSSLAFFEQEGMIYMDKSSRSGTVFTVLKYENFQQNLYKKTNTPATHQNNTQSNTQINTPEPSELKVCRDNATHHLTPDITHRKAHEATPIQEDKNKSKPKDINTCVKNSETESQPKKKTRNQSIRKPQEFKDFFEAYPEHRKGGKDQAAWNAWKSESLTTDDAVTAIKWLKEAGASDPLTWGKTNQGQFCLGIVNFIRNRIFTTPVPRPNQSRQYQTPDFKNTDYTIGAEGFEHV
ncbi:hypothetical protein [uncultured Amphritea sp.]|uniref:hypothetical protein n=1 Tax=uncultured Amphritea sp. TaxID=981605 RepID=UPI0026242572|nr:hypothetical protein [uncultured Amphritea sp.]